MAHHTKAAIVIGAAFLLFGAVLPAFAKSEVGKTVAIRGKASIQRGNKILEAKVKSPIELDDKVSTAPASRIKLLFSDDSVLTLAEKSSMVVKEYVHSKEARGKSLFNLVDGKMRAVVGKTRFEVQTPTAVAAARGTVILFETGTVNGAAFTRIVCLEGNVEVRPTPQPPPARGGEPGTGGPGPGAGGPSGGPPPSGPAPSPPPAAAPPTVATQTLTPGMMVTFVAGQVPPPPTPAPPAVIQRLQQETSTNATGGTTPSQSGIFEVTPASTPAGSSAAPVASAIESTNSPESTTDATGQSAPPPAAPVPQPAMSTVPVITVPVVPPINQIPPTQYRGVKIKINIPTR